MTLHRHSGACHCGNIQIEIHSTRLLGEIQPRSCDCSFCSKHGAIYVSDPKGKLAITVRDRSKLNTYRQGSASAEFLMCAKCGVLAAVVYAEGERLYATVNGKALENSEALGEEVRVSPWKLGADEKKARWKDIWFANVSIV